MKNIFFAAVALVSCVSSVNANTVTFADFSISDTTVTGGPVTTQPHMSTTFQKFNAATGVLTGVSSTVSLYGGTTRLTPSGSQGSSNGQRKYDASASLKADLTLNGFTFGTLVNQSLSTSCGSGPSCFTTDSTMRSNLTVTATTPTNSAVVAASIPFNSYVGTGNLISDFKLTGQVNLATATGFSSAQATLSSTGLQASQSLDYISRAHSQASFSNASKTSSASNTLNSQDVYRFSVSNLGNAGATGMDSATVACSGNCNAFTYTSSTFTALAQNSSSTNFGSVSVASNNAAGSYSANYTIDFADQSDIGATASQLNSHLLLTVYTVVQSTAPVVPIGPDPEQLPEPETYALLCAGLGVMGVVVRRRKKLETAI